MILALDYGSRYIGVAATDHEGKTPYRHSTIDGQQTNAFQKIKKIVEQEKMQKILVGLPVSLDGTYTQQTARTQTFISKLRQELGYAYVIETVDETLTSVEAEKHIRFEGGDSAAAHSEAARILLEDYLRQNSL